MCTLCLSDMGELNDEWMRAPKNLMTPYVLVPRKLKDADVVIAFPSPIPPEVSAAVEHAP